MSLIGIKCKINLIVFFFFFNFYLELRNSFVHLFRFFIFKVFAFLIRWNIDNDVNVSNVL
jgi:hypothetical protein